MPEKYERDILTFDIRKTQKNTWEYFKKYHYLNESLGPGHYYLLTIKDKYVGFIAISRFPHPKIKDIMTISRLVIVPEFQGLNIGIKFMNEISKLYSIDNRIRITTSLKPFINSLKKNRQWDCVRFGRSSTTSTTGFIHNKNNKSSTSANRITATFQYNG